MQGLEEKNRGSKHLQNVGHFLPDYIVQHPRRQSPLLLIVDLKFIISHDSLRFVNFMVIIFYFGFSVTACIGMYMCLA
jgi:hypothetical protein